MTSDTAKKVALVIDSSFTECKKDMAKVQNSASPRDTSSEKICRSGAEELVHSCNQVGLSSEMKEDKLNNTRYFIIKSLNHQNIQMSIEKGIWATQVMNEHILEEAFQNSGKVILIFSVNMSGFFQGYAQMMSSVGWRRDNIWSQGSGKHNHWGRSFKVKWLCLNDLPFQKTLHLKNPWNDFKPVKISRDCQELPGDIGETLCELLDEGYDMDIPLKRDEFSGSEFSARRPYIQEQLKSIQDENVNVHPMLMGNLAPVPYPSLLCQYQVDVSRFQLPHHKPGVLPNKSPSVPEASKIKQSRSCHVNGSSTNRSNSWGFPADGSPFTSIFTEDDILEMTYEEYLEAHSRGSRNSHHSAAGRSMNLQKSSSSKERSDDSQLDSSSKKRTYSQSLE